MFIADTVEPHGEPGQQEMHAACDIRTRGPKHKVEMIRHDRISEDVPAGSQGYLLDRGQERIARPWVIEDCLAIIAARIDMENYVGTFFSGFSSHARMLDRGRYTSNLPIT
jgi:hypothetical protein